MKKLMLKPHSDDLIGHEWEGEHHEKDAADGLFELTLPSGEVIAVFLTFGPDVGVQLRAGGPRMVAANPGPSGEIECYWFVGDDQPRDRFFPACCLEPASALADSLLDGEATGMLSVNAAHVLGAWRDAVDDDLLDELELSPRSPRAEVRR